MNDSNQTPWKWITGIAVVAAVVLGFLWMQARQGTVEKTVADSLRQENSRLASTVEELRAAPPETVYAQPPGVREEQERWSQRVRTEVDELEAVLPSAESHPVYYQELRAIRTAVDSLTEN